MRINPSDAVPRKTVYYGSISAVLAFAASLLPGLTAAAFADEPALIAHWKLTSDSKDSSGNGLHATNHGVRFSDGAALFDGREAYLEVPDSELLHPGTDNFTISLWIHTEEKLDDVLGDLVCKFDPQTRTGAILSIMNYPGVTNAQSNHRNLVFGIDANTRPSEWEDLGRPGNCRFVRSLCVFDGDLYASTWEPAADDVGGVYRFDGKDKWTRIGPDAKANAISSLCVCGGRLYAASEWYDGGGSSLPPFPEQDPRRTRVALRAGRHVDRLRPRRRRGNLRFGVGRFQR